jgi:mannose-1-phosphate guanylyltransferase/mannose-6-phosphate isomerase
MKTIILAGGAGTRLWPKSRKFWPKFLLKFAGDKHSLLQDTFLRLTNIVKKEDIYIVTNKEHKWLVKENIQDLGINFQESNLITEPEMMNTLPAIAVSAKYCLKNYGDEVLGIFPSDHYVKEEKIFCKIIKQVSKLAQEGYIIIFGIKATRPETGYGYIEVDKKLEFVRNNLDIFRVKKFIEKPDIKKAKKLFLKKNVFWNSGMFMFKSSVILEEIKKFEPEIFSYINTWNGDLNKLGSIYKNFKNISIDKGVIEKTDKLVCVPLNIFWDDVGSWLALDRIYKKDINNNILIGDSVDLESKNITVYGTNRLIATAGLKDLIIVDTEDALLVVSKNYTEKVKNLVEQKNNSEIVKYHKTTTRPWGFYTVLEHKNGYKVKLIKVLPKKRLSLQKHQYRDEEWFVVYGIAKVVQGKKEVYLKTGEAIKILKNVAHRLENPSSKTDLEIIEISHGKYLGEDDIIRLEDDFKR